MSEKSDEKQSVSVVRVWDLPTRLFHWTLVVLIANLWLGLQLLLLDRLADRLAADILDSPR
mgnify:CR=1 FL=1